MSIPQRGSRPITVDGDAYLWRIRKHPTRFEDRGASMTAAIQAAGAGPRCVLVVDFGVTRPDSYMPPYRTGVTPVQIADVVRRALAAGWKPRDAGPSFAIEYPIIGDTIGLVAALRR